MSLFLESQQGVNAARQGGDYNKYLLILKEGMGGAEEVLRALQDQIAFLVTA